MNKVVPLHGFGGGGALLNFEVVGGTVEPTYPRENTIWVNTDKKITGYYFSATQPENMTEGEVWFPVGTSSSVAFSVTRKNVTMVYLLSAKQQISGTLETKTAEIYQGGEWKQISLYWFENGVLNSEIGYVLDTGDGADGWWTVNSSGFKAEIPHEGYWTWIRSKNKIDATNYKTLQFVFTTQTGGTATFGLTSKTDCSSFTAQKTRTTTGAGTVNVDISKISGDYYIGFYAEDTGTIAVETVALIP